MKRDETRPLHLLCIEHKVLLSHECWLQADQAARLRLYLPTPCCQAVLLLPISILSSAALHLQTQQQSLNLPLCQRSLRGKLSKCFPVPIYIICLCSYEQWAPASRNLPIYKQRLKKTWNVCYPSHHMNSSCNFLSGLQDLSWTSMI